MKEISSIYELAFEFALFTNQNIFITGKAGTGKTTFLRNLKSISKKQMAVVAPTGVAAINAGGTTIHSFFQLPFTPFLPTTNGRKELMDKIKMVGFRRKVIQELELLVIDEISMVRADTLDAIDTVLRQIRFKHNEPFGGVQLIFIGDMFQLSPVAVENEWRLLSGHYKSPYFFHSLALLQQQPIYIEFDKIYRQSNNEFIQVLNQIRNNCLTPTGIQLLQNRFNPFFTPKPNDNFITLTTHNHKADRINNEELSRIKEKSVILRAEIKGEFSEKAYPTERELVLKKGAKVMFIKNDNESARRFYNGKIGIVRDFEDDKIIIECNDDGEQIELGKMLWENIRYSTNDVTRQIEEEILGTFIQYPLRLAWAITIHKSQGLTFDNAIIDAGDAFAPGQVYVALSRCRTLEGIILRSKINPSSIENNREIVEHEKSRLALGDIEYQLNISKNKFRLYTLIELFDFKTGIGQLARTIRDFEKVSTSFNEDTFPFLKELSKELDQIQTISMKFQSQLTQIFGEYELNEHFLTERLQAAASFFCIKTQNLIETINESPATTDSRDNAKEYSSNLESLFSLAARKNFILSNLTYPFSVETYFSVKNNFILPDFKVNAYSKTNVAQSRASNHPELYLNLLTIRNSISESENIPVFFVANSRSLLEMSDLLPQTEKELLRVYGFGPAKVEKYGSLFLDAVKNYCKQHNLKSNIMEFAESKTPKKKKKITPEVDSSVKKQKGETYKTSYEMFRSGKTIEEIATERNLAISTICSHLSRFISFGDIEIDNLLARDKREMALKLLEDSVEEPSYKLLEPILTPIEINIFYAWLRELKKGNP